jgi:hypothetical protein
MRLFVVLFFAYTCAAFLFKSRTEVDLENVEKDVRTIHKTVWRKINETEKDPTEYMDIIQAIAYYDFIKKYPRFSKWIPDGTIEQGKTKTQTRSLFRFCTENPDLYALYRYALTYFHLLQIFLMG